MKDIKSTGLSFIEQNSFFIFIAGIMLGGVLIGTLAFCGMNEISVSKISFISQGFIGSRAEKGFVEILIDSFLSSTGQLLVVFVLGFWAVSQPLEVLIPFLKGLGLGASLAQIYSSIGIKGFLIILLLIIPYALISVFALIIAIREAIKLSNIFARKAFYDTNTQGMKKITKLYCQKFAILEVLMIIASLVDSTCSFLFVRFLLL